MFTIDTIKEVRDRSGRGLAACKDALQQVGGDADAAVKHLVGSAAPKPREGNVASQGRIFSYTHHTARVAVLVEINCETDFAAKSPRFTDFGEAVAMQVAAMDPPDLDTLLDTPSILESGSTVRQIYNSTQAVLGENVIIRRFTRWSLGD